MKNFFLKYWRWLLAVVLIIVALSVRSCVIEMNKVRLHPEYLKILKPQNKNVYREIEHKKQAAIDSIDNMPNDSLQRAVQRAFGK